MVAMYPQNHLLACNTGAVPVSVIRLAGNPHVLVRSFTPPGDDHLLRPPPSGRSIHSQISRPSSFPQLSFRKGNAPCSLTQICFLFPDESSSISFLFTACKSHYLLLTSVLRNIRFTEFTERVNVEISPYSYLISTMCAECRKEGAKALSKDLQHIFVSVLKFVKEAHFRPDRLSPPSLHNCERFGGGWRRT